MSNYIYLDRDLFNHPLWLAEPFTKGQAWVDILFMAGWTDKEIFGKKGYVKLERGQFCTSYEQLAERWQWSKGKVVRYAKMLEKAKMCSLNSTANGTVITVENYSKRQDKRHANEYADGTQTERRQVTNKEIKEIYKETRAREDICEMPSALRDMLENYRNGKAM